MKNKAWEEEVANMADEETKDIETTTEPKHPGGRPETSEDEKNTILQKLEPYLKSGLSVRKALLEAGIANSTFYEIYGKDVSFRSKIDRFKQYLSVLLNSSMIKHLHELVRKQAGYKDVNGQDVAPQPLDAKDLAFLQWFSLNSNLAKEEYGERKVTTPFDPEVELQKMQEMIDAQVQQKLEEGEKDMTEVEEQSK